MLKQASFDENENKAKWESETFNALFEVLNRTVVMTGSSSTALSNLAIDIALQTEPSINIFEHFSQVFKVLKNSVTSKSIIPDLFI